LIQPSDEAQPDRLNNDKDRLTVTAELDTGRYSTGVKIPDREVRNLPITATLGTTSL
jgi:hypothetical protein